MPNFYANVIYFINIKISINRIEQKLLIERTLMKLTPCHIKFSHELICYRAITMAGSVTTPNVVASTDDEEFDLFSDDDVIAPLFRC